MLFQTGYITIKEYNRDLDYYTLGYPNREVGQSFIDSLLQSTSNINSNNTLIRLTKSLLKNDLETFFESIDILFSKIDYDLHLKNEKYWQSIFYMILTLLGYKIHVEFKTVKGRIDAVIETKTHIYIFEFKTTQTAQIALDQIKKREYYTRFKDSGKNIVLVASQFLLEDKKIVNKYESEELN